MTRYDSLLQLIKVFRPQSIIEVGTWNGTNAVRMLQMASKYHEDISYVGFDLFEEATSETDALELNVKAHNELHHVQALIQDNCPKANVDLVRGNTRETLKPIVADFAFIDGGHSVETIAHDYKMLKGCKVIILDDYYSTDEDGRSPNTAKYGCNQLVATIPHVVLPHKDRVKEGGFNQLVMVIT